MLYPLSYEGGKCAHCCAKYRTEPILWPPHGTTVPDFVRSGAPGGPKCSAGRAGAAWGRLGGRPGRSDQVLAATGSGC